ncbi:MAG: oligoribonuclease [Propionibacteriaceae bacterium]|nr:oligoribonuclease [Propionibacteriaceae bacterium]
MVWLDCEMTGLDLRTDALIEVAVLVTDAELNVLGEGMDIIITPPAAALEVMSELVTEMHTTSGLLACLADGVPLLEAEQAVMDYVRQYVPEPGKAPLAGNSIATDRGFLVRDMPTFEAHLHYRNIDVSSVKELARRWYPRVFYAAPEKRGNHRALGDIMDSINELRYYREALFVPSPGPTKLEARQIAKRYAKNFAMTSPASLAGAPGEPAGSEG